MRTLKFDFIAPARCWHYLGSAPQLLTCRVVSLIAEHLDYGSLITIDFMLSDTSEFEGGQFHTLEPDGQLQPHTFERGDAIIFLSHKYHCVTPVTAGRRNGERASTVCDGMRSLLSRDAAAPAALARGAAAG